MTRKQYAKDHWIKSSDPAKSLQVYMNQQKKAYSKIKNHYVKELLGNLKGKDFLDYGCGAGMFVVYAAREGASSILGVDAEETVLSTARLFAEKEGVEERCEWLESEYFPSFLPSVVFDIILLKDVIEHIEDDEAMLCSASQAIKPDGAIVLSTQNAFCLNYLTQGVYHRMFLREKDWFGWDKTHLRFYTPCRLSRKLKDAGLKPVAWRSAYIIPHKFPALSSSGKDFYCLESLTIIDKTLGHCFPWNRLGWSIMVKAIKV
jgi:2-polyprenyl-6-hydroxyphenyl methylase / 3-demethylubiquinone-9 3-methyltransferase